MKSYYYFLIPDALAWDMPKLYDKRLHKKMNMMRDKSICMENRENGLCSY